MMIESIEIERVMPQLRSEILFSGSGWSLQRKLVDKTRPREAAHFSDEPRRRYP